MEHGRSSDPSGTDAYWAFISYSHTDVAAARWLQRGIETYRLPKRLPGRRGEGESLPRRLRPVFRDRDELPASSDLGLSIREALSRSRNLVVVCSPRSARSKWVDEEVRAFKRLGRADRIFCVLVDGEPHASGGGDAASECFCPALRHRLGADGEPTGEAVDPGSADARPGRERRRDVLLRVVAGILDVSFDELKQRHAARRQRQLSVAAALALVIAAALGLLAFEARRQADRADRERGLAEAREAEVRRQLVLSHLDRGWERYASEGAAQAVPWFVQALQGAEPSGSGEEALAGWSPALRTLLGRVRRELVFPEGVSRLEGDPSSVSVTDVVLSPDGRTLAVAMDDGRVQLWAGDLSRPLRSPLTHGRRAVALAYSRDGALLASYGRDGDDGTLRLWDVGSGTLLHGPVSLGEPSAFGQESLTFMPQGKALLVAGVGNDAFVWTPEADDALHRLAHEGPAWSAATDAGGRIIATGSQDGTLRLWDARSHDALRAPLRLPDRVEDVALSSDARRLAAACGSGAAFLWRLGTDEPVAVFQHDAGVARVAFGVDDGLVATGSWDGTARVWSARTGQRGDFAIRHGGAVVDLAFADARPLLATAGMDGVAHVWNLETHRPQVHGLHHGGPVLKVLFDLPADHVITISRDGMARSWPLRAEAPESLVHELRSPVTEVEYSFDGSWLVAATLGGSVWAWDLRADEPDAQCLHEGTGTVQHLAMHPSAPVLAMGGWDKRVRRLALGRESDPSEAWEATGLVDAIRFSPDGRRLAIGIVNGGTQAWQTDGGEEVSRSGQVDAGSSMLGFTPSGELLVKKGSEVVDWDSGLATWESRGGEPTEGPRLGLVALSPEGTRIVTTDSEGKARILSLTTGLDVTPALVHGARVSQFAFSPDGEYVATAGRDGTVCVWSATTGERLGPFLRHEDRIFALRFSPDSRLLATGSFDGTARLWHVRSGRAVSPPLQHGHHVISLAFTPDGRSLATGSGDGVLRTWDVAPTDVDIERLTLEAETASLRRIDATDSARRLTPDEWFAQWRERRELR